jgi:hypothetical protein
VSWPLADRRLHLTRDPQFCEAERHIRGLQPALSEYETALAALKWLARFGGETADALASANPGLAQPQ